ncbi:MAG: hypothetical protein ACTSQ1_13850 [Promethearchaeota archaeon]
MPLDFYNPPLKIFSSSSTKKGIEIGGAKSIISIDSDHNFYNEGNIYSEMSWAAFYEEEGLEDVIDTFSTTEFDSIREDPEALVDTIVKILYQIINNQKIFYGIADFEVDAFLSTSAKIQGLDLDYNIINKLLEAHKRTRERDLFPKIISDNQDIIKIKIEFQGTKKKNVHIHGSKLEDLINQLRLAKGFAVGIVCTSRNAANMYIMSDNIVFSKDEIAEMYIDEDNIKVIEYGIKKKLLFPISWFRIDIGIRSLETLELWDQIKDNPELNKAFGHYERYINALVYKKFKSQAESQKIGTDSEEDWINMTPKERKKALRDMEGAIKFLNREYKE